jgi:hypothetical protein
MQQNALSLGGGTGLPEIPPNTTAAPGMLRLHIMHKNGPKEKFPCLPPGGMINAHGPETGPVEIVGPEPGFEYGI